MEAKVAIEEPIKIRAYARLMGVSDTSIHKAINSGKITAASWKLDKKGGKLLYPSKATAEWGKTFDPTRTQPTKAGSLQLPTEEGVVVEQPHTPPPPPADGIPAPPVADDINNASVAKLKQISEKLKIAKAQLELKELQGSFVPKKDVYDALFSFGKEIRQAFQAIPDRVLDNMLAADNRTEAHNILSEAISQTLEQMAEIIERDITKRK